MCSSKAVEYVRHRSEGAGVREAARLAGYAGGTPSESAVRLWGQYRIVQRAEHGELVETLQEIARLEDRLQVLRARKKAMSLDFGG